MTIAIGMVLDDAVILSADTLFSDGYTNEFRTKLFSWSGRGAHVGFAFSGNANTARLAVDSCREALEATDGDSLTKGMVLGAIRPALRQVYEDYVDRRPHEERESHAFNLMIGLSAEGRKPELYASYTTSLARVDHFECVGIGRQLARYIIESGYDRKHPALALAALDQVCALLIQALVATKDHVSGVDGASEFLLVTPDNVSPSVPLASTSAVEPIVRQYHHNAASLFAVLVDPGTPGPLVDDMLAEFVDCAVRTRERWLKHSLSPDAEAALRSIHYDRETKAFIAQEERERLRRTKARSQPLRPSRA